MPPIGKRPYNPYATPVSITKKSRSSSASGTRRRLSFKAGYGPVEATYESTWGGSSTALGVETSKSTGFISSGSKVKKSRGANMVNTLGTTCVIEKGGVLDSGANTSTAGNTVVAGHCTLPTKLAHLVFWRAVVKKIMVLMKHDISDFEAAFYGVTAGDIFRLTYRLQPDSTSWTQLDWTATVSNGHSAEVVAQYFHTNLINSSNDLQDMEFQKFSFIPYETGTANHQLRSLVEMDLRNAKFMIYSKSSLKLQNRSVNTTGNADEEAVDNVPLYGKSYQGKGSGSNAITNDVASLTAAAGGFWCDSASGTLAKVPTEKWYQEIPQGGHFRMVKYSGKVHLDPGHIKTSTLSSSVTISLNKVYRLLFNQPSASARSHEKAIIGEFRFIMLEKMIAAVAGTAENSIKLAFEHNIRMGGYITLKRDYTTAQMNSVANYANEV